MRDDPSTRDVAEATLTPMIERDVAQRRRRQGVPVVHHAGHWWEETRPGFFQPVHLLARLGVSQVTRPACLSWGFRASLCGADAPAANGSMVVHLLTRVATYDLHRLSRGRRLHVRKCFRLVKIVQVTGPALLSNQGHEVVVSAAKRTAFAKPPSRERYLEDLRALFASGQHVLVLAGLVQERLVGYVAGFAVGRTAYIDQVHLVTDALTTNVGSELVFEFVQVSRRSGAIDEIVYGQHAREDPSLDVYKKGMGFPVTRVPTKVYVHPLVGALISRLRPDAYYRLTGHDRGRIVRPGPVPGVRG